MDPSILNFKHILVFNKVLIINAWKEGWLDHILLSTVKWLFRLLLTLLLSIINFTCLKARAVDLWRRKKLLSIFLARRRISRITVIIIIFINITNKSINLLEGRLIITLCHLFFLIIWKVIMIWFIWLVKVLESTFLVPFFHLLWCNWVHKDTSTYIKVGLRTWILW